MKAVNWEKTLRNFKGRFCCGGIDLSAVSDFICAVYAFPRKNDREYVDIIMRTWCPEEKVYSKKNKYRASYIEWVELGWMHATPGNVVDYDIILKRVADDVKNFNVGLFGVDAQFQGIDFSVKLGEILGHTEKKPKVIACYNTPAKMGPVCQEFERRLLKKKINHGGNPIFRFMADSITVRIDPEGNKKPDKDKSQGKIDGIMALLYALGRLILSKPPKKVRMPMVV